MVDRPAPAAALRPFALATALVLGLTALRLAALFTTPLELYPDEAQYWAWSRELAFGYVSKPPLIAWLIAATTAIGGDTEPWVRLSAPLVHAGAALALYGAGTRLYGGWTGFWAAVLYSLMPGVQLSAGVMSTDAPLFLTLSLALWAYACMLTALDLAERLQCAAGLGLALGLACLAKYAALYFLAGLVLHAIVDPAARRLWGRRELLYALGLGLAIAGPNLAWNALNGFATVGHTVENASWGPDLTEPEQPRPADGYDFRDAPGFFLSQFVVFGPIPFAIFGYAAVWAVWRRQDARPQDRMLVCLALPPLAIVLVQAAMARANANWAAAAYAPASVLVAALLVQWRARRLLSVTLAMQGAAAAAFLLLATWPGLADRAGLANSFKRARGWSSSTAAVLARAESERRAGGLSAIAVDDRFLFNAMTYYGRRWFAEPGAVPLTMWMRRLRPYTQAERDAPLTPTLSGRVLGASLEGVYLEEMRADFRRAGPVSESIAPLDPKRRRRTALFVAEYLAPAPRNPATGLPIRRDPTLEGAR